MCSLGSLASEIEQVERLDMGGREPRRVGEALRGVDVLALVDRRQEAPVPAEHRNLEIGLLAFRHLAAPVGGDRLEQQLQQVGPAAAHLVEDRGRTHQRRQAAGLCRLEAQQADDVAGIGVIGLALVGLVDAHVGIADVEAEILHVAQHMALAVLRARAAEMDAQAEERRRRLAHRPALDRQAAHQQEAAAGQHFVAARAP